VRARCAIGVGCSEPTRGDRDQPMAVRSPMSGDGNQRGVMETNPFTNFRAMETNVREVQQIALHEIIHMS
jgi:hypothetical protein